MRMSLFSRRLTPIALVALLALPEAAVADPKEEIEFARGVVKAKLESERTGVSIEWTNPETGNVGRMEILETQILDRNLPCRWYEWSVDGAGGSNIETEGKACRLRTGEWLLEETAVVRETKRVEVPVEVVKPAPKPEDPMAEVVFTRPDSMVEPGAPGNVEPVEGGTTSGSQQED